MTGWWLWFILYIDIFTFIYMFIDNCFYWKGDDMIKNMSTMIGGAIAGIFVMSVWGEFAESYGIAGGWFAALIIIGTMWFLNHHIGLLHNPEEGAWVDMALAIGVCGTLIPVFTTGSISPVIESMPTLIVVILGGIAGGIIGEIVKKDVEVRENDLSN